MFKRILVPLDGSKRAESALPIAARIARTSGGSVILVQTVVIPIDIEADKRPSVIYSQAVADKSIASAASYLEGVARADVLARTQTQTEVVKGAVAPSILAAVQSLQADLVVLCSHGYTGLKLWALGSVAHKLVPHSPVPVLVLQDGGPVLTAAAQQPVRAVVPLDGSPLSESALEPAAQLVAALAPAAQRTLQLLRVVDIAPSYSKFVGIADSRYEADIRAETKRDYEAYLANVAKHFAEGELAKYNLTVTSAVALGQDVAEAIVQAAEQSGEAEPSGYNLIVMASHGRGGLQCWALGSVAERVLHATRRPLMVVHAAHGKRDISKDGE